MLKDRPDCCVENRPLWGKSGGGKRALVVKSGVAVLVAVSGGLIGVCSERQGPVMGPRQQ